jgi:polysaccharide biosynthesis transport protein
MTVESQAMRDARIDMMAVLGAVVVRLPRIILVTMLLLAATFAFLMFQPRMYESGAGILVEPRSNIYTRATNEPPPPLSAADAGVVSSQIELIKSRDTLLRVIDDLDLRSVPEFNGAGAGPSPLAVISRMLGRKPAPANVDDTVFNNLLDRLTVIQERDSRIISVLVRSTDPDLAAAIANAIAQAHVARRAGLSLSDTAEASGWLGAEIAKLRVAVTEAETKVANFKIDNDLFVGTNNTSLLDQQLSTIANQITETQERKSAALSRAALIRGLVERGQPVEGVADVRDSATIQQLSQEKARLQGERAQKSATLLPNHPSIQALTAQINELDTQMNLEGRRVADALEAEAEIEGNLEASLRDEMARVKASASTATQDNVTLDSLQREAKAQRDLLESYLQRYGEAASRTGSNAALPDVRVVTLAAPSSSPASPRVQLILMAVGLVSLAAQIGIVVFGELMSGRAIVAGAGRDLEAQPERPQDELETPPFIAEELEPDQRWEEPAEDPASLAPSPLVDLDEPEFADEPVLAAPVSVPEDISEPIPADEWDGDVAARVKALAQDVELQEIDDPDAEDMPESLPAAAITNQRRVAATPFDDLSADVALGRTRLLILAGSNSHGQCEILAEALAGDALDKGLSVALVDAGSGRPSAEPGISDLSLDAASFGDVVHKSSDSGFAEVPWGQGRAIDRRSQKPLTLLEALGDIYEVVILMTGRVGMASTLPLFAELEGRLVLVAGETDQPASLEAMRTELAEAGFGQPEIVTTRQRVAA